MSHEPIKTFTIPEGNREAVVERLEALRRRIEKKGLAGMVDFVCGQPYWMVEGERFENRAAAQAHCRSLNQKRILSTSIRPKGFFELTLEATAPVLAGWKFIARIYHLHDTKTKQLVNAFLTVPGEEVPKRFRNVGPCCEHCGCQRLRKYTFICRKGRAYKQVGSNCLKDFLGHDPEKLLVWYEFVASVSEDLEREIPAMRPIPTYDLDHVLTLSAYQLSRSQFVSSKFDESTVSRVLQLDALLCSNHPETRQQRKELEAELLKQEEYLRSKIAAAREWAAGLKGVNTFEANQLAMLRSEQVPDGMLAQAVYWVEAVRREEEKVRAAAEREATRRIGASSAHLGSIGQRLSLVAYVLDTRPLEGYQGREATLVKFRDLHGNRLAWFASSRISVERTQVLLVGTVKAHTEYQGVKETLLTRCVVSAVG